jgi:phosphinothricin acetyltransferase
VGRALYASLLEIVRQPGFYQAYAGITLPNAASVGLHEAVGFRPLCVYRNVGFKLGHWHDVGWWELALRPADSLPAPPRLFAELRDSAGLRSALDRAADFLGARP